MAEFPSAYVQVKLEPVEDEEYDPNGTLHTHRNNGNSMLEDDMDSEELEIFDVSPILTPLRRRKRRTTLSHEEQRSGEMDQLKAELSHATQIISEQSVQLETAEKRITEQQGQLIRQEELLLRTEADRHTDKAVADAEIVTLRQLLGQERKKRIFTEQKNKKIIVIRKSNYGHAARQKSSVVMRENLEVPNTRNLANFGERIGYGNHEGRPTSESESIFRYRSVPVENAPAQLNGRNTRSCTMGDVEVIDITSPDPGASRRQVNSRSVPLPTVSSAAGIRTPNPESGMNSSSYSFPCTICGVAFNEGWKLVRHNQLNHRRPRNSGNLESNNRAGRLTTVPSVTTARTPSGIMRGTSLSSVMRMRRRPAQVTFAPLPVLGRRSARTTSFQSPVQPIMRSRSRISTNQGEVDLRKKFICPLCSNSPNPARFFIVSQLKTHMRQAHHIIDESFSIGCKECGRIFASRKQHVRHRRHVHGTKYSGGRYDQSRSKINVETVNPPQEKPSCPEAASAATLTDNLLKVTSSNAFRLLQNQLRTAVSGVKVRNENVTPTTGNVEHAVDRNRAGMGCYCICGRSFRTALTLKEHIRHSNTVASPDSSLAFLFDQLPEALPRVPENKRLPAPDRALPTQTVENTSESFLAENGDTGNLIPPNTPTQEHRHQLVGTDPKVLNAKYSCSCGRVYFNRASFFVHSRSKNKGKIFKCSVCSRAFDLHGNLKLHVKNCHKISYGQGRYGCGNCAQTFESSRLLTRHRFFLCKYRNNNRKLKTPSV